MALDPPSSPTDYDVEIQTNTFSGWSYQVANAQPSAKWTDRDGEWLIKSFVGAHNMKYRGPAIAKVVAGAAVPTAQDGSIVVSATSKSVWNKTTMDALRRIVQRRRCVSPQRSFRLFRRRRQLRSRQYLEQWLSGFSSLRMRTRFVGLCGDVVVDPAGRHGMDCCSGVHRRVRASEKAMPSARHFPTGMSWPANSGIMGLGVAGDTQAGLCVICAARS